jgi:hypothetical protein
VDGHDGVARVVGIVEQGPQLGLLEGRLEAADGGRAFGLDALALGGQLDQDLELLLLAEDALEELDVLLEELLPLLEGLGQLLVLPDLGRGQARVYRPELAGLVIEVKENLGPLRPSRRGCPGGP